MLNKEVNRGSTEMLILALLEDRPRHGYEIAKLIEERSEGVLQFHPASLYPLLYLMEKRELIKGTWIEKARQRRRRFYKLMPDGKKALNEQRQTGRTFSPRWIAWPRSIRPEAGVNQTMNPNWNHIVREHLAVLRLPPEREIEIVEELALHLEASYEDALADGLSETEAEARAMQGYDWRIMECELSRAEQPLATRTLQPSLELIERKGGIRMGSFIEDMRFGVRMLAKNPGFTLIAVMTLALGIGANTAIFTILNAVALRPFDFEQPERLVICWESNPEKNLPRFSVSAPNFKDWQAQQSVFEQMAVFKEADLTLSGVGGPEALTVGVMSAEMFALLRVKPMLGSAFTATEEQPGREQVVVLTHKLWQRRFGGDRGIVGRNIKLNGKDYSVIGVMDARFRLMGEDYDAFVPVAFTPKELTQRGVKHYMVVARLKDGVTLQRAQNEIQTITERIKQADPEENEGFGALLESFQTVYAGGSRQFWGVLFTAVGFVLLIGCANLSNLLLARAAARQKEIAIRLSVGASRRRVIRQLLTESFLLALLGGALGLLLASWGKDLIVALDPEELDYYRVKDLGIDYAVLAFTLLLSLLTALLFGLAPATHASNPDLNGTLKDAGHSASGGLRRHYIRKLLVISEVALAMVLLVGAGLTFRSMRAMRAANPGFNPHNLLTMTLTLSDKRYPDAAKRATFFDQLLPKLAALPGVQAVGLTNQLPISDDDSLRGFVIEGRPKKVNKNDFDIASLRSINSAFFNAMGMRLLRGRAFTEHDNQNGQRVTIINETMAKRYWTNEDPLGKHLSFENEEGKEKQPKWREIVGVVNDVKHQGLNKPPVAEVYFPYVQRSEEAVFLAVRSTVDPKGLIPAIRQQALNQDAEQSLSGVETMEERMANFAASDRLLAQLLGVFAALALLLAALGLYGVIAYAVAQRTREIGIRLALGAHPGDVLRLALKQGMLTTLLGVAVGLPLALGLTQFMKTMLFGVKETDPLTFVVMTLLLAGVALLACFVPASRATKVDPLTALRHE